MSENILFIIDEIELKYFEFNDLVTDFWFIKEFLQRDYRVCMTTKNRLFIENAAGCCSFFETFHKNNDIFYEKEEKSCQINDFDVVFFRPDPPVDVDYINACSVFDFVDKSKTILINDPTSVRAFNEKMHVNYFPSYAPKNIVTSSASKIKAFVQENKEAIIKPLNRCFGSGVFYLNDEDKNLHSIVQSATNNEKTLVMVQQYLKKAQLGDKRVLICSEKVYDKSVRKLPGENDFKFNTHSDKFFEKTELSENEKNIAKDIAKTLNKHGLFLVGLDVIDEKVIEINVTSPCYFIREINNLYGINFENEIMEDLLNLIAEQKKNRDFQLLANK